MLTQDVKRLRKIMRTKDFYEKADPRDLKLIKSMHPDLFQLEVQVADSASGIVEQKKILDPMLDRNEIFNRLKSAGRI